MSDAPINIAVLMVCHNRCDITLKCLESLYNQQLPQALRFDVYLVDDGSSDGTNNAVRRGYPEIKIMRGDGSLFWCGGMRLAWAEAAKGDYDAYIWLNDDTILYPNALDELFKTSKEIKGIVIGSCCDPVTGAWTHGGRSAVSGKKSFKGQPVKPNGKVQPCQLMNGNLVFIPRTVFERIGALDCKYTHAIGDYDYGLKALNAGVSVVVAPGYLATCTLDDKLPKWCDPDVSLRLRLSSFNDPKGANFNELMTFCLLNFGIISTLVFGFKIVIRVFSPRLWIWKERFLG